MRIFLLLSLCAGLAGCSTFAQNLGLAKSDTARNLPFKAKLTAGEDKRDYTVAVKAPGAEIEDVRESVRHPATRHCLYGYGNTNKTWVMDEASGDWAYTRSEDGTLTFTGRCTAR